MKRYVLLLLIAFFITQSSAADLNISAFSGAMLPVANITVTIYNDTGMIFVNDTDINGILIARNINGSSITIRLVYPSSAYSARIDYINGSGKVFLGDTYGATLRLVNTLGQPLEGQDCSVAIYRNDTNELIKWYDTSCRQGERYIDSGGNEAAVTDCPLTDSSGQYYFTTTIKQEDGFQYGLYYTTRITCNAKSTTQTFYVDVQKPPDVDMMIDFVVRYIGGLILFVITIIIVLIGITLAILIIRWVWKKRPR